MRKHEIRNIAHSVHDRLHKKSLETKRPFNELMQYYALERFLYRLSTSEYVDNFILKGALLLTAWGVPEGRPTKDIDLLGTAYDSRENIIGIVKEICMNEGAGDGLVFHASSVESEPIAEETGHKGVRVHVRANLENTRFKLNLDICFGDVIVPRAEPVCLHSLLGFPVTQMRGYSKESVVAEKFEAMVKYGVLNSRMKDFYDIWLLSRLYDFEYAVLSEAITRTFDNRRTAIPFEIDSIIEQLGSEPSRKRQWQGFLQKNKLDNAPKDFSRVLNEIRVFISQPLQILRNK